MVIYKGHKMNKLGLVSSFFLLIALIACNNKNTEEKRDNKIEHNKIIEQKSYNRVFRDIKLTDFFDYSNDSVYYPIDLKIDGDSNMFICDMSTFNIKKISQKELVKFGDGRGMGPKQMLNISDFEVFRDTIYVLDGQLRRISMYKTDGTFIKIKKMEIQIHKMAILDNYIILTNDPVNSDEYFSVLDRNFNYIKRFAARLDTTYEPITKPFIFEGVMTSDNGNKMFYGFTYFGVIIYYNLKNGKLSYIRTIDKTPIPEIKSRNKGGEAFHPTNVPISCLDCCYNDGKIYVLSLAGMDVFNTKLPVIDVYSADNMTYKFTFSVPIKIYRFSIKGQKLYAINKNHQIVSWKIEE
jgi:hypothetical protein